MPGVGVRVVRRRWSAATILDELHAAGVLLPCLLPAVSRARGLLWQDSGKTLAATVEDAPIRVATCPVTGADYTAPGDGSRMLLKDLGTGYWGAFADGSDDRLVCSHASLTAAQPLTVYAVFAFHSAPAVDTAVFDFGLTGNFAHPGADVQGGSVGLYAGTALGPLAQTVGTAYQWRFVFDGANSKIRRTGLSEVTGAGGASTPAGLTIASTGSGGFYAPARYRAFVPIAGTVTAGQDTQITTWLQAYTGVAA